MTGPFDLAVVGGAALLASLLGAVAGSGSTAILLPVLVLYFGVRDSIPIVTIANFAANLSRAWFNRGEISLPVVRCFTLGAIPFALGGALLFALTPASILTRLLGAFLLLTVAWRRLRPEPARIDSAAWFIPLGAAFGLLTGLLEGVGPLMAPFFLAHGLVRGAYIGTDALATVLMQAAKLSVFGAMDLVGERIILPALVLVPFMIAGAFIGKKVVDRVSESLFAVIIDATLVFAGMNFLLRG